MKRRLVNLSSVALGARAARPAPAVRWHTLLPSVAALVSVFTLGLLWQTTRVTTTGYEVQHIEAQNASLRQENRDLAQRAAELQGLNLIERQATERLRMVRPSAIIYVDVSTPPEVLPTATRTTAPAAAGNVWQKFLAWLAGVEPDSP